MGGGGAAAAFALVCIVVLAIVLPIYFTKIQCKNGFGYKCPSGPETAPVAASGSGPSTSGGGAGGPSTSGGGAGGPSTSGGGAGGPSTSGPQGISLAGGPSGAVLGFSPETATGSPSSGPRSGPASGPRGVNCVGHWGPCSVSCGTGSQTYIVDRPAGSGGESCKDTDGTARANGDTKPCSNPPCGVNCVGDWVKSSSTDGDGWGACSATCGSGTQTRTYRITTQQAAGGDSCPKGDGATESKACPNLPACVSAVNCVGAWGEWTGCSAGCGGGTRSRTYYVSTPAAGTGTACPNTNGQTQSEACNTTACCDAASAGAWTDVGGVICNGSSSPNPYIYQTRAITFPSNPSGTATATGCNLVVSQYRLTAGPDQMGNKCPDEAPTAGTCSYGNQWSSTAGCAITPATTVPTAGVCSAGQWFADTPANPGATSGYSAPRSFDQRYGWSVYNTDGSVKLLRRWDGSQFSGRFIGNYIIGSATSKGGFTATTTVPDALKGSGCYQWVDARQPGDIPNQRWEQRSVNSVTCPTGYTATSDKKNCTAPSSTVTGLTCSRSGYFTANNGTNKCVAK